MTSRIKEFPGTPLTNDEFKKGKVITVKGGPKAEYAWDTGIAIGHYLAQLKEGKIVGRRCDGCHRVLVPPRWVCEWCFRPTAAWVRVKDTGRVNTFSICYITWNMIRLETPQIPAVIEIDGAAPGAGFLHLLGDVDPKKVKVGMKVKAVWKKPEERTGSITDIAYFKPA